MISGTDERDRAVRLGAAGYLTKPVQTDALVSAVEGLVSGTSVGRGRVLVVDDDPQIRAVCAEVSLWATGRPIGCSPSCANDWAGLIEVGTVSLGCTTCATASP